MILIYAYGGGHYTRFAATVATREELHRELDRALDQGYDVVSITVEAA